MRDDERVRKVGKTGRLKRTEIKAMRKHMDVRKREVIV